MFKVGDYVKVKPNTHLASGELVNNWAGQVEEVFEDDQCCVVSLDALTLDLMDETYLVGAIDAASDPRLYVFSFDDLEQSVRRDTDEAMSKAVDRLADRVEVLEEIYEQQRTRVTNELLEGFKITHFYKGLNSVQKKYTDEALYTFVDVMYHFAQEHPNEWTPRAVQIVCLNVIPSQIVADAALFENYGTILSAFIQFLTREGYLKNTSELLAIVKEAQPEIPLRANDPDNWDTEKTLMMEAQRQGFDLENEEDLERFLKLEFGDMPGPEATPIIPIGDYPFKGIGRNEKITVRYDDGRVVENIKFKKVEQDLKNGDCVIVES